MEQTIAQIITGLTTACLGLMGTIIIAILSAFYNSRTLRHLKHEDEKKQILQQLNEFYGPYQQKLETSRQLYDKFRMGKPEGFRTLLALLNGEEFTGNDKSLYEEILRITDELEKLRMEHSGLVDDNELQVLLSKAGAHYRIIKLAYEGEIIGEPQRFMDYVYPRELNGKISAKIASMQKRLAELNN